MEKKELLRMYRLMLVIRRLEERASELYQQGKIGGFLHLYIGQEAVGTGVVAARQPQDRLITAYRDHGIALAAGIEPKIAMAELLGKRTGCSMGFGGSMHMADVNLNYWGGHAIVGAHLPFAAGMALKDKMSGSDAATLCLFGDGATNIGYFHESLNLSMVWDLPVLWICENNQYGMGTAVERASAVKEIRQKAEGYGMPNGRVDGMDVLAVRQATAEALEHVRTKGPYLLEAVTYRYQGHSMGDPERYRTKDEITKWEEHDPIGIFRKRLLDDKSATAKELDKLEKDAEQEIEQAVAFAESSPEPTFQELVDTVYVEGAE
jgi:pyruvate dehydrogenase E1 component subunit alpha